MQLSGLKRPCFFRGRFTLGQLIFLGQDYEFARLVFINKDEVSQNAGINIKLFQTF